MAKLADILNGHYGTEEHWSRAVNRGALDGVGPFVGRSVTTTILPKSFNWGGIELEVEVRFTDGFLIAYVVDVDTYVDTPEVLYWRVRRQFQRQLTTPEDNIELGEN